MRAPDFDDLSDDELEDRIRRAVSDAGGDDRLSSSSIRRLVDRRDEPVVARAIADILREK